MTVVSDFEINVALKQMPPLNKRRIGNAKNSINAAAFNRINTVLLGRLEFKFSTLHNCKQPTGLPYVSWVSLLS